jgi:hypothetical protein
MGIRKIELIINPQIRDTGFPVNKAVYLIKQLPEEVLELGAVLRNKIEDVRSSFLQQVSVPGLLDRTTTEQHK